MFLRAARHELAFMGVRGPGLVHHTRPRRPSENDGQLLQGAGVNSTIVRFALDREKSMRSQEPVTNGTRPKRVAEMNATRAAPSRSAFHPTPGLEHSSNPLLFRMLALTRPDEGKDRARTIS